MLCSSCVISWLRVLALLKAKESEDSWGAWRTGPMGQQWKTSRIKTIYESP